MCVGPEPQFFLGMPAVVASEAMRDVLRQVEKVAQTTAAVLITGESGTGKELVARAVHHYSLRCARSWVDVCCAALPENLIESELFGYEKGAFSGADTSKPGLFELAHTGTLFLDEIGELDRKLQVKLLRVLDGTPYYRLGGVKKVTVDVRMVAATNQDLERAVREGRFRSDLYHRLGQIHIRVPPLRERPDDIVPLAKFFLGQQDAGCGFSEGALEALGRHGWPGNVRELRNAVIQAAALRLGQTIERIDLPCDLRNLAAALGPAGACNLEGLERRMILQTLAQTGGHHRKAAELLGISRRTLSRKLKHYGVEEVLDRCVP